MKKNKLSVDLGNLKLTDAQLKSLLADVHKTVNTKLKGMKTKDDLKKKVAAKTFTAAVITPAVATATISATFTNTNPGLSELRARHKGINKTLTQSGSITFDNVKQNDIISIQGKSLGSSDISIDISASPQQKKFGPGTFNFNFFIL